MKAKPPPTIKDLQRQNRELRRALSDLTQNVSSYLARLDAVMTWPSTEKRGKRTALLANGLDLANDTAMHFALKDSMETIGKRKAAMETWAKREEQP